ncbi:MAG: hypothetical protein JHC93_04610 [Parachlamydiales bacterium]|nr:hypothetical protein [Parachlamydiales bacterium]
MSNRLRILNNHKKWDQAEAAWDEGVEAAKNLKQIKSLKSNPKMVGVTKDTMRFIRLKGLKYIATHPESAGIRREILKRPFVYTYRYIKSLLRKKPYDKREGDFFYFGLNSEEEFKNYLKDPDAILVVGFGYCHKPFECPSGRFTTECIHDIENPVCRQCFIGKSVHLMPENNVIPLYLTTLHYFGHEMLKLRHKYPDRNILFMVTTCEMTFEMTGDFSNMIDTKGIGVRLDGRICNTMCAFKLSENGIKPGLTVVLDDTQKRLLDLLRYRHESTK